MLGWDEHVMMTLELHEPPRWRAWILRIVAAASLLAACEPPPEAGEDCWSETRSPITQQSTCWGFDTAAGFAEDRGGASACTKREVVPLEIREFGDAGDIHPMDVAVDRQGNLIIVGYFTGTLTFEAGPVTSHEVDDVFVVKLRPDHSVIWSRSFGDDYLQQAMRVAVDPEGEILIIGHSWGTIDFGGGPLTSAGERDVFVAKLSAAGDHVWSKRFGDARDQRGRGIATDRDGNVFIAGSVWGAMDFGGGPLTSAGFEDIFVAKLDRHGAHVWSKRFGDAETQDAWDLTTDGDGNVVMAGFVLGDVDFGDGLTQGGANQDAVVVKLSGDGDTLWSRRYGDHQHQASQSVAVDSRGNVLLTGAMQGTVDFGKGPVQSAGRYDAFVVKLDVMGEVQWHRQFGDRYDQLGPYVAVDDEDAVLLTGFFLGSVDFGDCPLNGVGMDTFVAKLSPAGSTLWSQRVELAADKRARGIASGLRGEVVTIGIVAVDGNIALDAFVARRGPPTPGAPPP